MNYPIRLNLIVSNPATTVTQMALELNRLSEAVIQVTRTIELLEHSLSRLVLTVSTSNISMATQVGSDGPSSIVRSEDNNLSADKGQPAQNGILEAVARMEELGDAAKDVVGALLPQGSSKISEFLGMPANIASGAEGFTEMSTKANTTTAEKISIGSKILTEAAGMLMAGLEFELPGLIIYTVAEAITTYAFIAEANKQKQKRFEAAQKKRYERAMRTFVMDENSADAYVNNIVKVQRPKQQPVHKWKIKINPADEVTRMQGKGAYDLNIPIPIAAADQLHPRLYLPKSLKYDSKDTIPVKRGYFEETFHLQQQLMAAGTTGGNSGFVQGVVKAREESQRYDKIHHTHTLERTDLAIKESAYDLLSRANGERQVADDAAMARKSTRTAGTGTGRTVVINLNRPMIEHFTITTSDTKNGIGSLKEQVEQALLEILNSANL